MQRVNSGTPLPLPSRRSASAPPRSQSQRELADLNAALGDLAAHRVDSRDDFTVCAVYQPGQVMWVDARVLPKLNFNPSNVRTPGVFIGTPSDAGPL